MRSQLSSIKDTFLLLFLLLNTVILITCLHFIYLYCVLVTLYCSLFYYSSLVPMSLNHIFLKRGGQNIEYEDLFNVFFA